MTGSSGETKTVKEGGVESKRSNEVTIPETRVELEKEQEKKGGEGELHRTPPVRPDIRDRIAKAHKLIKYVLKAASFGRFI